VAIQCHVSVWPSDVVDLNLMSIYVSMIQFLTYVSLIQFWHFFLIIKIYFFIKLKLIKYKKITKIKYLIFILKFSGKSHSIKSILIKKY